jgi:ribosome-associated toxin RatA of RatAB toxin-antitoxin module
MRTLEITAKLMGIDADEAYRLLAAFDQWPAWSPVIRSVEIQAKHHGVVESAWKVAFLEGTLQWTEEDVFDPLRRTCRFRQLAGDADDFHGDWSVSPCPGGCRFRFRAEFDLGLPSLSDILEPIAEDELRDNLHSVLSGMFGDAVEFPPAAEREALAARVVAR